MLVVEQFRGRSERLVRQELYAHFTLAALSRLFANPSEEAFREGPDGHGRPAVLANFRHNAAHGGAPSGRAVPEARQGGGRCAAADPGRDRGQPPAAASGPLLSAPFAQARDEVEEPQGSRNRKSSYSLTPSKIRPEPEFLLSRCASATKSMPLGATPRKWPSRAQTAIRGGRSREFSLQEGGAAHKGPQRRPPRASGPCCTAFRGSRDCRLIGQWS